MTNAVATPARAYQLVAIAASAGGFSALKTILGALPATFPAAIALVLHRSPGHASLLAALLGRVTPLHVKDAEDDEEPLAGVVYVAPSDKHLTITPSGRFRLVVGPRICHVRSSANPLFETAAPVFGAHLVAVVLTGYDHDAADGVQTVAEWGGIVLAEDPSTAQVPAMPRSAIATGVVRGVLQLNAIAPELLRLVTERATRMTAGSARAQS